MLIIRPVAQRDLEDLLQLAHKAGQGMTSLPPCAETLQRTINKSQASFDSLTPRAEDYFLLVLEDLDIHKVVGTAAIYARTDSKQAFYAYRVMPAIHYSHSLAKEVRSDVLHLANDYTDCSEVGTLFVDPDYRGNGHWLAKARYLFMGVFRERFHSHVVAELRGWLDDQGKSPFWDAIGQHFFEMSFDEADRLCATGTNQFITELMPKHPIYTRLLSEQARAVLGKPHQDGRRALQLLEDEGFENENFIDIFDAGPMLRAKIDGLTSVKAIKKGAAAASSLAAETTGTATPETATLAPQIVMNGRLNDLRIIKTPVTYANSSDSTTNNEATIELAPSALDALGIQAGDLIYTIDRS
ncbi:arginine N-succinyltransferase [Marinagarivorans algicola]|uniref:arginine N-succinyltransferase n=1 Tax=Marinagarivorans algicola TaxID=1513270 RepID=UPI0006B9D00F|nr:arginine N-succinyltransferase [Marinagarivorans algicola]